MERVNLGTAGDREIGIDLDLLLKTRLLVQANSGGGKSWLLRRLAEHLYGKVQVILIDPEGEFATLREQFGYVLIGKGGEAPADPRSAAQIAHKLLELQAPAVCDLYELAPEARHAWVRLFLDAMIDAPRELWHPVIVILDEAHQFCPERGHGDSEAKHSVISMATRARKRGFCIVLATQRLGKLCKDAAAELQNILIGQTFLDVDLRRAAEALGIPRADQARFFEQMKCLEPGRFYALGRAISTHQVLVKVGPVQTAHPEPDAPRPAEPPPPPEQIRSLLPATVDKPKVLTRVRRVPVLTPKQRQELGRLAQQVKRLEARVSQLLRAIDARLDRRKKRPARPAVVRKGRHRPAVS